MKIEIYSDVVCPWCYLGQARFRQAVAAFPGAVEIVWRPFQLDPAAPVPSPGLADVWLEGKFGGAEGVAGAHSRLRALTGAESLPYEPERALRVNSLDAHRVIWAAGEQGVQDAVVERLFRAHHAEGQDVSDPATLAKLAEDAGLPGVQELLASEAGRAEVAEQVDRAGTLGINGVPFFLFEGQWGVSGAQPTEVFSSALEEVAKNLA